MRAAVPGLSGSLRRLGGTMGAQLFSQMTTIVVQLALVPILLSCWGTSHYGAWLLLTAIPTYLTFADFGFTFVAKNEMVMRVARNDRAGALATFQSVFWLLNGLSIVFLVLVGIAVPAVTLKAMFSLGDVSEWEAKAVLMALCVNVIAYQYLLLTCAGIRSEGRPAAEVMWAACARLGEGLVTAIAAVASGDLAVAAIAILVHRLLYNMIAHLWLRSISSWLRLGWNHSSTSNVRALLNPSISYMFVTIAQALVIQGPVVILGILAHPIDVVVFASSRTLARLGTSAANVLNFSITPEYSRLFGLGALQRFRKVMVIHFMLAAASAVGYLVAMMVLGNAILLAWTKGAVGATSPIFTVIVLAVAAEMIWSTLFTPLASINRHVFVSYSFVVVSIIGTIACWLLSAAHGTPGLVWGLVAINGTMVVIAGLQVMARKP